MLRLVQVDAPAAEPVSLVEARTHLRIDGSGDDDNIENAIEAARTVFERETGRALITQSFKLALDCWPTARSQRGREQWWSGIKQGALTMFQAAYLELPRPPLQDVISVTVYDLAGNPTLWGATNYQIDTISEPGRLAPKVGVPWPQATRGMNAIEIVFLAGYGDDSEAIPFEIRRAILALVAHFYENRGDDDSSQFPSQVLRAIANYRIRNLSRLNR